MNMDFAWKAFEYISAALDKPAQWFAALVNLAPKSSLAVAAAIAFWAVFL